MYFSTEMSARHCRGDSFNSPADLFPDREHIYHIPTDEGKGQIQPCLGNVPPNLGKAESDCMLPTCGPSAYLPYLGVVVNSLG